MQKAYFDLEGNPLASIEGLTDYVTRESLEDWTISINYLEGEPVFVDYEGSPLEAATSHHQSQNYGCGFQVGVDGVTWVFADDGTFKYKTRHLTMSAELLVEEELDANDRLIGGTAYLMENEVIRYAIELDSDRKFVNCFDFKQGVAVPVETIAARLELA